jgi:hypothetical protein
MKIFIRIALLLFFADCFIACGNNKDYNPLEYIFAQPKDADLIGWWKCPHDSTTYSLWYFQQNAALTSYTYTNEALVLTTNHYWFTEKQDENILHIFTTGFFEGHYFDNPRYYKIANDSIWMSADLNNKEWYFWGKRSSAP